MNALGRFKVRCKGWLGSRRALAGIVLLAVALAAPSLTGGFAADDHLHRLVMRDTTGIPGLSPQFFDLFIFADGDPASMKQLMDKGVFPWTTDPELRLAFSRPLSALTHQLDNALWPEASGLIHAHNLAWFALLLVIVGLFYRRVHAVPWVAGLALLMYALDDVHGPTFSWIANRQSMISACLGFGALIAHDRWRQQGWLAGRLVGPALLALALLAGESGLAVTAYLFAYAVSLDRGSVGQRARTLLPYALVAVTWLVGYKLMGYGASFSGAYVDPGADPGMFASQASTYLPVLLTSQLAGVWSDFFPALPPDIAHWFWIGCLVYLLLFLDVVKLTLKEVPAARFWALGMVLSALPVTSTIPADRLLIFVGVGAMGLVACFFEAPEGVPGRAPDGKVRAFSVWSWTWGLVLAHLILGPMTMPVRARTMHTVGSALDRASDTMPMTPDVANKTVIGVNPPADPLMAYVPLIRASRGQPVPDRQRWLAVGQTAVTVTREDPHTVLVSPEGGYMVMMTEQLVRHPKRPMALGHKVALAGVTVEVASLTADGRPATTRWRFERVLEDPGFIWLRWADDHLGWTSFVPPAVGASVTLPPIDTLKSFLGPDI